ncbi:hypothetical protein JTB14_020261 [Gonioctena quinquepunctata]|nr:hypothetical protein JTB14_020261 [Gonioctena quinquepunctata]
MLLVEEVEKLKITDKVNNYDKSQAWIKVTTHFNAKGPSQRARSIEQLKGKYENLKTKARKYAADNKKYLQATGGWPSHHPDWGPVIEAILRVMNGKTVIGFYNPAVDNPADEIMNIEVINQEAGMERY